MGWKTDPSLSIVNDYIQVSCIKIRKGCESMLVKGHLVSMPKIYWVLLIPIYLVVSYYNIFFDWQLQYFGISEAEDFGRYVFVLFLSFCQCIIYILLIRLVVSLLKHLFRNKKQEKL